MGEDLLIKGWHFLPEDGRLSHGDGRRAVLGETLSMATDLVSVAHYGLHACRRPLDALHHAPSPLLCRVELTGNVQHRDRVIVARNRRVVAMADVTDLLHGVAVDWARQTLSKAPSVDERSTVALDTKDRWLHGQAEAAEVAEAWSLAWQAVQDAANHIDASVAMVAALAAGPQEIHRGAWQAAEEGRNSAVYFARLHLAPDDGRAMVAAVQGVRNQVFEEQNQRLEGLLRRHGLARPTPGL